ncbi:MAG: serine/threonine-protein kinase [Planctomycetota bacterium]
MGLLNGPELGESLSPAIHAAIYSARQLREAEPRPKLPGYCLQAPLGAGGQATVYAAVRLATRSRVAVKVIPLGVEPSAARRFKREVGILERLNDPCICPILDAQAEADRGFVVMPLIDGEPLSDRLKYAAQVTLRSGRLQDGWAVLAGKPCSEACLEASGGACVLARLLLMVERIAMAVHVAHEQGVVHRDLKPSNILMRTDGTPVVIDFGLASDALDDRVTTTGRRLGTPAYMAPEQREGAHSRVDQRTDVYALGLLLFELLTFRRLGRVAEVSEEHTADRSTDSARPRLLNPAIPRDLEAVCLRALEVEPGARYPTAEELAAELRRVRRLEPTLERPLGHPGRHPRRTPPRGGGTIELVFVMVYVLTKWCGRRPGFRRLRRAAEEHARTASGWLEH